MTRSESITDMRDNAQQTIFYQNAVVEPHSSYEYDALYRLIKAEGREHIGQNAIPHHGRNHSDYTHYSSIPHANDSQAMQRYTRSYEYDELGNIEKVKHNSGNTGWSRTYEYNEDSLLEPNKKNNRLTKTILTNPNAGQIYTHDIHGNMTTMPHLPTMFWDFADQLKEVELATGREYYTYTIGGGKDFGVRTRKVTEQGGKIKDRIYIGDYEVYREKTAGTVDLERTTLHIQDDKGRIALVDTLTMENGQPVSPLSGGLGGARYQLSNHLGSATLEVDDNADLISYEEYYPFGASSYRAGRAVAEVGLKRYRYVGKEFDNNTGLYEYGARYYASWLCRFVSVDDLKDEYPFYTPFQYAGNKPVTYFDLDGLEENKSFVNDILELKEKMEQKVLQEVSELDRKASEFLEDSRFFPITIMQSYSVNLSLGLGYGGAVGIDIGNSIDEFGITQFSQYIALYPGNQDLEAGSDNPKIIIGAVASADYNLKVNWAQNKTVDALNSQSLSLSTVSGKFGLGGSFSFGEEGVGASVGYGIGGVITSGSQTTIFQTISVTFEDYYQIGKDIGFWGQHLYFVDFQPEAQFGNQGEIIGYASDLFTINLDSKQLVNTGLKVFSYVDNSVGEPQPNGIWETDDYILNKHFNQNE